MQVTSLLVALTFAILGSTSPAEVEPNKVVDVQPQQTCDISVCKRDCEAAGGVSIHPYLRSPLLLSSDVLSIIIRF